MRTPRALAAHNLKTTRSGKVKRRSIVWRMRRWLFLAGLLVVTGFGLFNRSAWAGVTAIFLAMLSALANFFFIPYYPFWAILVIALDIWVIWALTRPGAIRT